MPRNLFRVWSGWGFVNPEISMMRVYQHKESDVYRTDNKESIVNVILGIISIAVLTAWYMSQAIILALFAFIILAIWWFLDWRRNNEISKEFGKWIKGLTKNLSCSILLIVFSLFLSFCLIVIFGVSEGLNIILFEQIFKNKYNNYFLYVIITVLMVVYLWEGIPELKELVIGKGLLAGLIEGLNRTIFAFSFIMLIYCIDHGGSLLPYWITGFVAYMLVFPLISVFISIEKRLSSFLDIPSTIAVTFLALISVFIPFISIYIIYSDSIRVLLVPISFSLVLMIVLSELYFETDVNKGIDKIFIRFSRQFSQVFTIIIITTLLLSAVLGITPDYESRRHITGANTELVVCGIDGISLVVCLTCNVICFVHIAMFSSGNYPYSNPIKTLSTLNYSLMEKNAENLQQNAESLSSFSVKGNEKSWRKTNIFVFYIYLGHRFGEIGNSSKIFLKYENSLIEFMTDFYNYRIDYRSPYRDACSNYDDQISHEIIYMYKYFTQNDTKAKLEELRYNAIELDKSWVKMYGVEKNNQNEFENRSENVILVLYNHAWVGENIDELIENHSGNYIVLHNQSVVNIFPNDKESEAQKESAKYKDGIVFFVPTIPSEPMVDSV